MGEGKRRKRPRIDGGGDVRGKGQGKDTVQVRKGQQDMKGKGKVLGIQPGESLGHFNRCVSSLLLPSLANPMIILERRVEDDMRPLVKSAMQTSSAQSRKVKKSEQEEKAKSKLAKSRKSKTAAEEEPGRSPSPPPTPIQKHAGRPTEFQKSSSSAPRRLNDIAQAPPEFKKLPRGVKEAENIKQKGTMGREGVLSMKQKAMMEEEREKAIARYRALKERRRVEGGDGGERDNREDDDE